MERPLNSSDQRPRTPLLRGRSIVSGKGCEHSVREKWIAWLWLFTLLPAFASAATLQGKVIHIADGDTLTVLVDHQRVKVRLAEIDAPESHQDYGQRAKQALGNLVFGRDVSVADGGKDRYGRTIGRVRLGQMDVNAEMVRTGYAWVYRKYAKDESLYALEDEARTARRGLWAGHDPVPPWEWRKETRKQQLSMRLPMIVAPFYSVAVGPYETGATGR